MANDKKPETSNKLFDLLGKELPEEAIQRTKKAQTRKGYDTDGYAYQYCVDRFNDILGEKWGYAWEIINSEKGQYNNGTPYYDITIKVNIWVNDKENIRPHVGGHIAVLYADALKGAISNAFKKTAAMWGVGRQAYQGALDDDNKPLPEEEANNYRKQQSNKPNSEFEKVKQEIMAMARFLSKDMDNPEQEAINFWKEAGSFVMNGEKKIPPDDINKIKPEKITWLKRNAHTKLKKQIEGLGFKLEDIL